MVGNVGERFPFRFPFGFPFRKTISIDATRGYGKVSKVSTFFQEFGLVMGDVRDTPFLIFFKNSSENMETLETFS